MTTSTTPEIERSFFTIGGTLPPDAPSYIGRKADTDLYTHLMAGDFCYVLTSRQMGKSSLMVRTAVRLRESGCRVATIDLTEIGKNVTPDQWYNGMLVRLGRALGLDKQLKEFRQQADQALGSMQRWQAAIRNVVIPTVDSNVVIFIDEIDGVRSLPFSTDEFFEGIRNFYTDRATHPELRRITFCLVGVATPSDLIQNLSTTPFNIGFRIALSDFTEKEAAPLIQGFDRPPKIASALLRRVLWWTGGHPYLTQRLSASVAEDRSITTAAGVDRLCGELFLSSRSRETDNNLQFVGRRITDRPDEGALASLLDLYGRVRDGKKVPDDETSRDIGILRLAGIVKVEKNRLVLRNRIYANVFDQQWIRNHMPDAELRRQREAFRRGILRTAALAAVVIAAIAVFTFKVLVNGQRAAIQRYSAAIIRGQEALDSGDFATGLDVISQVWASYVRLKPNWPEPEAVRSPFLRRNVLPFIHRHIDLYWMVNRFDDKVAESFEYDYLISRIFGDAASSYFGHRAEIRSMAISPDGKWLATAGADSTVRIFDIGCYNNSDPSCAGAPSAAHPQLVRALAVLDNDGKPSSTFEIPAGPNDLSVNAALDVELARRHEVPQSVSLDDVIHSLLCASPADLANLLEMSAGDLDRLVPPERRGCAGPDNNYDPHGANRYVRVNVDPVTHTGSPAMLDSNVQSTLSAKGMQLIRQGKIRQWAAPGIMSVRFSPDKDGAWIALATGSWNTPGSRGGVYLWSAEAPQTVVAVPTSHLQAVDTVVFRNATEFASTGEDNTAEFWRITPQGVAPDCAGDSAAAKNSAKLCIFDASKLTTKGMNSAAFSPDGRVFAAIFGDGQIWIRDASGQHGDALPEVADDSGLMSIAFYDQDHILLGTRDGRVVLFDVKTRTHRTFVDTGQGLVTSLAVSTPKDGAHYMITTGSSGTVLVWTMVTEQGALNHADVVDLLRGERDVSYAAVFTPDQRLIFSGGADTLGGVPTGRLFAWTRHTSADGTPTWASQPLPVTEKGAVQALAYSPDGKRIASIRGVSASAGLNAPTEVTFTTIEQHDRVGKSDVLQAQRAVGTALAWSADGKYVATAGNAGSVLLWNTSSETNRRLQVLKDEQGQDISIVSLGFAPDGTLVGAGVPRGTFRWNGTEYCAQDTVFRWNPEGPAQNKKGDPSSITGVMQYPASYRESSDCASLQHHTGTVQMPLALSADGRLMAVCMGDNAIQVWKTSEVFQAANAAAQPPKPLVILDGRTPHNKSLRLQGQCMSVAFSPDGQWLAAGTFAHEVAVWSTGNWNRVEGDYVPAQDRYLASPPKASATINAVAFSPDSRRLAYGTADSRIVLWDVMSHVSLPEISIHKGGVLALAFSPDGQCLASGSNDKTLRLSCRISKGFLDKNSLISGAPSDRAEENDWIGFAQ